MIINLVYDSFALGAPQSFRDGMEAAANMLKAGHLVIAGITAADLAAHASDIQFV